MTTPIAHPSNFWSLIALSPQLGDLSVPLGVSTSVGRHQDNDIVLATQQISRQHAKFNQIGSALFVQDLGSSNGTFVNGERVATEAVELTAGDEVGFADILFVVANEALAQPTDIEMPLNNDLQNSATANLASSTLPTDKIATKTEADIDTPAESANEVMTEVVPLPATIISPSQSNETSQLPQSQPATITTANPIEADLTPATSFTSNTLNSSKVTEPNTSPSITQSTATKSPVTPEPISEQTISPVIPISASPIIPKKAPTQTWLVAIIIVILIVLAIIATIFLK